MISPYLYDDFWPFFLLIFSPLETADFLMLLKPSGDGYSLLCSKKQPLRHNCLIDGASFLAVAVVPAFAGNPAVANIL